MDSRVIEVSSGETVPVDLVVERDGVPVPLTGATVTFSAIWHSEWRGRQYTSSQPTAPTSTGSTVKINGSACVIDADQVTNPGKLTWTPAVGDTDVPGNYFYQLTVVFSDDSVQRFPRQFDDHRYGMVIHPAIAELD